MIAEINTFIWSSVIPQTLAWLWFLGPIWAPLISIELAYHLWLRYVRLKWTIETKKVILEVKLPQETFKSPLAMELILNAIHNTADGNWYAQYVLGEMRPSYALEIVSFGGQVKFMIWTEDRRKAGITAALYSQFPDISVQEVEDYADKVYFDPDKIKIAGVEFKFTKENPYPIKTYVDYGLDKDPKEEFKVDPLTPGLEWLGSIKADQQVWIQIIVRAHKGEQTKEAHKLMDEIMKRDPETKIAGVEDEDSGLTKKPTMSSAEQDLLDALARSITKPAFDVGIRTLYISPKDTFDTPFGLGGMISFFKHFNTENLNGFRPNGQKGHTQFQGYPWEDRKKKHRNFVSREILRDYRSRIYFIPSHPLHFLHFIRGWSEPFDKPLVLNTEELATIYHFPGSVAATPTLERIPSKRADAPGNLPI